MIHIFEHMGVMLHVEYTPGFDGVPTINSVRVTDERYRPIGPNLAEFLNTTVVLYPEESDGTREATPVLSLITEELPHEHTI